MFESSNSIGTVIYESVLNQHQHSIDVSAFSAGYYAIEAGNIVEDDKAIKNQFLTNAKFRSNGITMTSGILPGHFSQRLSGSNFCNCCND